MGYHPKDSVLRTTQIKFIISIQIMLKFYVRTILLKLSLYLGRKTLYRGYIWIIDTGLHILGAKRVNCTYSRRIEKENNT